jgi:hypothetical protein
MIYFVSIFKRDEDDFTGRYNILYFLENSQYLSYIIFDRTAKCWFLSNAGGELRLV